jgi:hypothetical protein
MTGSMRAEARVKTERGVVNFISVYLLTVLLTKPSVSETIQSVPGGKVNILGGHSMSF